MSKHHVVQFEVAIYFSKEKTMDGLHVPECR